MHKLVKQSCPIFTHRLPCGREALPTHPGAATDPAIQYRSRRAPAPGTSGPQGRAPHRDGVREHKEDLLRLPQ